MARWKDITDQELDARTIYVGSYGWEDNDPLGRVYGRTPREFELMMRSVLHEEAKDAFDDEWQSPPEYRKTFGELKDNLWYVGPFEETVGGVIDNMEDHSRAAELRDDIRRSARGWVY